MTAKNRPGIIGRQRHARAAGLPQLTARQRQILDWIRGFMETTGMPPTRAEIATGLGFSTPSSAEDHLQALARKGAIEMLPGASRGLRLKNIPGMPVQGTLPLVGRVAAGNPILAAEHIEAHYRRRSRAVSRRAPTTCCACTGKACRMPAFSTATCSPCIARAKRATARSSSRASVRRRRRSDGQAIPQARPRDRPAARKPRVRTDRRRPAVTPFAIEGVGVGLVRSGSW